MTSLSPITQSRKQRGVASLAIAALIMFILAAAITAALTMSRSSVLDSTMNGEQIAALFLAESGQERGQQVLTLGGTPTSAICKGIGGVMAYPLAGGTFSLSATSDPDPCDNSGTTFCSSCAVQSIGTVGNTSRTISRNYNLTTKNGAGCSTVGGKDCSNPVLRLTNTSTYPAVVLLNLAYDRQGQQVSGACTGTGCALQYLVRSKQTSASMGNSVSLAAGASYDVAVTLPSTTWSYVGAIFPGASAAGPVILHSSFWDQQAHGNCCTVAKSGGSGSTNNGVLPPPNASGKTNPEDENSTVQVSTKWCYGGDTLVYGFSGTASSINDEISNVRFNTGGTPQQNVPLTPIAKYPPADTTDVPSTHDVYSQIFYVRNPNLSDKGVVPAGSFVVGEAYVIKSLGTSPTNTNFTLIGADSNTVNTVFVATGAGTGGGTATPLNPFADNASSYKGNGTGAIGAQATGSIGASILSASIANKSTSFIVTSYASGTLQDGDILVSSGCTGLAVGSRVVSHSGSTYMLDTQATNGTCSNKAFTFKSSKLTVTAVSSGALYPTDVISGGSIEAGTSINTWGTATGGIGTYNLTGPAQGPTGGIALITANSTILHVTACTICDFESGDALSGLISGRTINNAQITTPAVVGEATGGIGRYPISGIPTRVASANTLRAGTPGATIYLPSNQSRPIENGTRVAVVSGVGSFGANTRATDAVVVNSATNSFTVSPSPTTTLDVARICAGTCAFFDNVNSSSATNTFTFTPSSGNSHWSSAFMCLKGVDVTPPTQVSRSAVVPSTWRELLH